jgi:N-ethylmaleimide reductase
MDGSSALLSPFSPGRLMLRNRIVMAPLTRRRATDDHVPTDIMRTYYEQRASAGLIIAEATNISLQAVGYMNSPGIFTHQQIEAWKPITKEVHNKGGKIFLQLWHVGRVSHPLLQPDHQLPVSSSAINAKAIINTPQGHKDMVVPRALETIEIPDIVNDYKKASLNAIEAGFDGVEIHGANGYLPDQFLHDGSNTRTDKYGGNFENRSRFILEVVESCCSAIGSEKVGIRLSPSGSNQGMFDSDVVKLYEYLIQKLNDFNLAYLHLMEPYAPLEPPDKYSHYLKVVTPYFRKYFNGTLITNVGFDFESANRIIREGHADLVAFGKLFISNPDLVERFAIKAPLNPWDKNTFYYGGEKGYIDYPFLT